MIAVRKAIENYHRYPNFSGIFTPEEEGKIIGMMCPDYTQGEGGWRHKGMTSREAREYYALPSRVRPTQEKLLATAVSLIWSSFETEARKCGLRYYEWTKFAGCAARQAFRYTGRATVTLYGVTVEVVGTWRTDHIPKMRIRETGS